MHEEFDKLDKCYNGKKCHFLANTNFYLMNRFGRMVWHV